MRTSESQTFDTKAENQSGKTWVQLEANIENENSVSDSKEQL